MKKRKTIFTIFHKFSAVFCMLTLAWLTVSTPFICDFYEELAKQEQSSSSSSDDGSPLTNAAEEKAPGPNTATEEYLHDQHHDHNFVPETALSHRIINSDTYHAYHGELLVPPPNFL